MRSNPNMKITRKRFTKPTRNKCRFNGQRKIVQFLSTKNNDSCQHKISPKYIYKIRDNYKKWGYICRFKK